MPNQNGYVYGLTFLAPILDDEKALPSHDLQIRNYLAQLSHRRGQSFRACSRDASCAPRRHGRRHLRRLARPRGAPQVQVPRLRIQLRLRPRRLPHRPRQSIPTTSTTSGATASAIPAPRPHGLPPYMKACQLETTFFFAAVNNKYGCETLRALQTQRAVADFIAAHQGMEPARPRKTSPRSSRAQRHSPAAARLRGPAPRHQDRRPQ